MGGTPWHYFTLYRNDVNEALQRLKEQEFRAGRYGFDYWLAQMSDDTDEVNDLDFEQSSRSADELIEEYGSVEAAMEAILDESAPDGTQSILDITHISNRPEICAVCQFPEAQLQEMLGTVQPTRELVEALLLNEEEIDDWQPWEMFWESIDRGTGRYIVLYSDGQPTEIFFAGYSFD